MDYRKAVVNDGNLINVVNVINDKIEFYKLQEGEYLVDDLGFQGMLKPIWNSSEWVEGATQEEINEHNYVPRQPPTEVERIAELEKENKLLKAQSQANADVADFHEELIVELAMMIYQ